MTVGGDIFKTDEKEGVGTFETFSQSLGRGADALAESAGFIGV